MAGIIGSLCGGYECELLGRKTCLMIENAMVFCSMILGGVAPSFMYLMIGRTVHGYCYGALIGAVPVYVNEICQSQVRSMVGGAMGTFYCLATASVFTLGAMLPWRWLLLVCSALPLLNLVMLIFASESPTWYVLRGRDEDALECLRKLRGNNVVAEQEYHRLTDNFKRHQECANEKKEIPKWRMVFDLLMEPTFRTPLLSVIALIVLGIHLSGGAPLLLYLNKIIIRTGAPGDPYWIGAALQISRAVLSIISSCYLQFFPKRVLCTIGMVIMTVANLVVWLSVQYDWAEIFGLEDSSVFLWMPIVGISLLYLGVASGQCHVIVCLKGELLPSFGRALGSGMLGIFDALTMFTVGKFLPSIDKAIGLGQIFLICAGICICLILIVWLFIPETRGMTLEEIEEHYRIKAYGPGYDKEKVSKTLDKLSQYDNMSMWGDVLK